MEHYELVQKLIFWSAIILFPNHQKLVELIKMFVFDQHNFAHPALMLVDQCIFCSVIIPWPWVSWTDGVTDPEISKTSIKSLSLHLLVSLEWSLSQHPEKFLVLMSLTLDIYLFSWSQWVLVLTFTKIFSLNEYQSRQPLKLSVLISLGLHINQAQVLTNHER